MKTYVGNFRLPLWAIIVFSLLIFGMGGVSLRIIKDGGYAGILRNAPDEPYGRLITALPGMAAFTVVLAFTALLAVFLVLQGFAAVTRRRAFVIDAHGVRCYNLFTGREKALTWGQIERASRNRSNLTFVGRDAIGRTTRLVVAMLGHKRSRVLEVIALYRADLAKALR
jgi:hypothetical protein